jgi:hypothetical protein
MGLAGEDTLLFKLIFSPESKNFDQYHCNAKKKEEISIRPKIKAFCVFCQSICLTRYVHFFLLKLFRLFQVMIHVNNYF